ncbi:MAG: 16S rRNA (adenine(1518)-N(6)/adenine(1519)-N(6))-dimethyltransferase RsmA [Clostridia bacterium]|nr:16S rRNA (adenine(1518)-N(6)/adenine(1519)-N(6))-dimethyltransferase RsmA [Clostridia bacterium]
MRNIKTGDILKISNKKDLKSVLESQGFSFKKSLGQNFLIDDTVCPRMAAAVSGENVGVLEIGPGAGVLTAQLSQNCKKVVSVELDTRLKPILEQTLADCDNVKIIWNDILKIDLKTVLAEEFADCDTINICANLPYYITSPVIMMLLESRLPINTIAVMVQKEAADRLCATVGSRAAGAVTVAVNYYAKAETLFGVPRGSFMPPPNVDSAVIKLTLRDKPPVEVTDEKLFFKIVKACFAQRRKILLNTVCNTMNIGKDDFRKALYEANISETVRGETLTMEQIASLANALK